MAPTQIVAMVRKDLQLLFSDRRAVIMSFAVPIAIASFFGSIFSGPTRNSEPAKIPIIVVDQDESVISKAIVSGLQNDKNFKVTTTTVEAARDTVKRPDQRGDRRSEGIRQRRRPRAVLAAGEAGARYRVRPVAIDRGGDGTTSR